MAVMDQVITRTYAAYNGDCIEVLPNLRAESIHLSIYSPPFSDLYQYSSSDRDLSNCQTYEQFLKHYEFVVQEIARLTMPGRLSVVHCSDIPRGTTALRDFPGDIIRLHEKHGFDYHDRHCVWKEPLKTAIRTRALGLRHSQIVKDSSICRAALADYVLAFTRAGTNAIPITHAEGLMTYAGEQQPPAELVKKFGRGWKDQRTNELSHWIWRRYASAFWDDIRPSRVLPYRQARETEEEKHVCPLQLDVIERCIVLWSNPGEVVLTPFMGIGSEVYGALTLGRRAVGIELKPTYYKQALANIRVAEQPKVETLALEWNEDDEAAGIDGNGDHDTDLTSLMVECQAEDM